MIVTDDTGRELEIKPLSMREQLTLAAAFASPADGQAWWNSVVQICSVRKFGKSLAHPPQSRVQFKDFKDRLGADGIRAVRKGLRDWKPAEKPAPLEGVVFRFPDEVEMIDILELGGQLADIPPWAGIAFSAAGVRQIGDEKFQFPTDMAALLKAVDRLDDPALMAALERQPDLQSETPADVEDRAKN